MEYPDLSKSSKKKEEYPDLSQPQEESFLQRILSQMRMPLGVNIASGLQSLVAQNPQQKDIIKNIPQAMSGQQPGLQEELAQGVGEFAPLMGMGMARGIPAMAARIGITSGYGAALRPEDRMKGAEEGLKVGVLGEAIPGALKGIGAASEWIVPKAFTNKMKDAIRENYEYISGHTSNIYNKIKDKFKDDLIYGTKHNSVNEYLNTGEGKAFNLSENLKPYLEKLGLGDLSSKFFQKPTYENAHNLQSQIATTIRKLKRGNVDMNTQEGIVSLGKIREAINDDLGNFLWKKDKGSYNKYEDARKLTREFLSPHDENQLISKITDNLIEDVSPQELNQALKSLTESKSLPKGHYLRRSKKELGDKIDKGNFLSNMAHMIGGGAAGSAIMPGVGTVGGAGAGAFLANTLTPMIAKTAQNPYLRGLLGKAELPYNITKGALTGRELGSRDETE